MMKDKKRRKKASAAAPLVLWDIKSSTQRKYEQTKEK